MAKKNARPWFKVFHSDELADCDLRSVSLNAVAVWNMLRCLMYQVGAGGRLVNGAGKALSYEQISTLLGRSVADISQATDELLAVQIMQQAADGALFSPAVAADILEYETKAAAGRSRWNRGSKPENEECSSKNDEQQHRARSASEYASASASSKGGTGENDKTWAGMADHFGDPNPVDPELAALVTEWAKVTGTNGTTQGMDAARYANPGTYGREHVMEALRWGIAGKKPWKSVMGRARSLAETSGWVKPDTKPKNASKVQGDTNRFAKFD